MAVLRGTLSIILLASLPALLMLRDPRLLAAAALVCAALRCVIERRPRRLLALFVPLLWFLGAICVLQWIGGRPDPALPARAAAIVLLANTAFHAAPWEAIAGRLSPRTPLYAPGLFLLFVRHFTAILAGETQRTLRARSATVSSLFRPGGASSLAWAVANIVRRTLDRAERFYAAQLLKGLAE